MKNSNCKFSSLNLYQNFIDNLSQGSQNAAPGISQNNYNIS